MPCPYPSVPFFVQNGMKMQRKILILTAIPHGLRLDKEIREIEQCIQRTAKRDKFEIRLRTAVHPQDIRRAFAEERPHIVHFCGHGLEDGSLLLEDDGGSNKPVKPEGLAQLFKLHADYVQCVLLNACHSAKSATAISQYINYAIGMNQEIQDKAAVAFSQGFYDALGYDYPDNLDIFQRAFDEALVAIQLEDISQGQIPVLQINKQSIQSASANNSPINNLPTETKHEQNAKSDNVITPSQPITPTSSPEISESPSSNEQIPEIPTSENPALQKTKLSQIFLRFLQNGLSLRKVFVLSVIVTSGLVGLRFFAVFEWLELKSFDHFMQTRLLEEKPDNRLLIVSITDEDIKAQDRRGELGFGQSLRDPSLNELLDILQQHQPRVIGLDLYRAFPVDAKKIPTLVKRLQEKNVVTVCKVPGTDSEGNTIRGSGIPPAPEIKSLGNVGEKVGFSDFVTDVDSHVRRHLMAQALVEGTECQTKESFSLLLARRYLQQEPGGESKYKITIQSGENPRIGKVTFPTVEFFTGGYQGISSEGFQVLLNYRAINPERFVTVKTLEDILENRFSSNDIKDKIILIGSYAYQEGARDEWSTPYGTMNGVMVHAQMVSQILSTVQDGRSLLSVWSQGIEIIWIGFWSFWGGFLVRYWGRLKTIALPLTISILVLYITCLSTLTFASLWIPFIPAVLAFTITTTVFIYIKYLYRKHT